MKTTESDKQRKSPSRAIGEALNGLQFGSVEIIVHNGRIVQIERREKLRFDKTSTGANP